MRSNVPATIELRTSQALAEEPVLRARSMPHAWVVADDEFGRDSAFRRSLRHDGERYLLHVPSNLAIVPLQRTHGPSTATTAGAWTEDRRSWSRFLVRDGYKEPIRVRAFSIPVLTREACEDEFTVSERLVVIEPIGKPKERRFCLTNAPDDIPLETLVRIAYARHHIEEALQTARGSRSREPRSFLLTMPRSPTKTNELGPKRVLRSSMMPITVWLRIASNAHDLLGRQTEELECQVSDLKSQAVTATTWGLSCVLLAILALLIVIAPTIAAIVFVGGSLGPRNPPRRRRDRRSHASACAVVDSAPPSRSRHGGRHGKRGSRGERAWGDSPVADDRRSDRGSAREVATAAASPLAGDPRARQPRVVVCRGRFPGSGADEAALPRDTSRAVALRAPRRVL